MAHIGYARVSMLDQDLSLQLDALAAASVRKGVRGPRLGRARRPRRSRAARDYVRDAEVLVVWKLGRLGRNLPHRIETVTALERRGVGFRSLTGTIDTTTRGGRLVFHLFAALGQFERDLIQERTRAGLTAAAARGRAGGRKPAVTDDKLRRARAQCQGTDRARGRHAREGRQDGALQGTQGRAGLISGAVITHSRRQMALGASVRRVGG